MEEDPAAPLRMLLVDDHEVVRNGLASALEQDPRFEVVASAGSGKEALERAQQTMPNVAIIDLRMPDTTGDELCADLRRKFPGIAVVILSSYLSEETVRNAVAAGATGYVTKSAGLPALREVLAEIAAGRRASGNLGAPQIVHQLHQLAAKRSEGNLLTPQQQTVLELAADGLTYHEIGARLHITESTVRFHIQNLKNRLQVHSKVELIAKAIRSGIIRPAVEDHLDPHDH
jgi:DNA-binding NarL/FixJ family response regulator